MKITGAMLLDKRIVQRHIDSGLVSREEYEKHLQGLSMYQAEDLNAGAFRRWRQRRRGKGHRRERVITEVLMSKETDSKLFRASPDGQTTVEDQPKSDKEAPSPQRNVILNAYTLTQHDGSNASGRSGRTCSRGPRSCSSQTLSRHAHDVTR